MAYPGLVLRLHLTRYLNRLGPLKWYSVTESGYRRTFACVTRQ